MDVGIPGLLDFGLFFCVLSKLWFRNVWVDGLSNVTRRLLEELLDFGDSWMPDYELMDLWMFIPHRASMELTFNYVETLVFRYLDGCLMSGF